MKTLLYYYSGSWLEDHSGISDDMAQNRVDSCPELYKWADAGGLESQGSPCCAVCSEYSAHCNHTAPIESHAKKSERVLLMRSGFDNWIKCDRGDDPQYYVDKYPETYKWADAGGPETELGEWYRTNVLGDFPATAAPIESPAKQAARLCVRDLGELATNLDCESDWLRKREPALAARIDAARAEVCRVLEELKKKAEL